jgi:hypothetical protein
MSATPIRQKIQIINELALQTPLRPMAENLEKLQAAIDSRLGLATGK